MFEIGCMAEDGDDQGRNGRRPGRGSARKVVLPERILFDPFELDQMTGSKLQDPRL